MNTRTLVPLLVCATVVVGGCSSMLLPSSPEAVFMKLSYDAPEVPCPRSFGRALTVFDFSEAAPYDSTRLIALSGADRVEPSSAYRWVASPGRLVAGMLIRDLSKSPLFPRVSGGASPLPAELDLTGRVVTFAWQRSDGKGSAVLDVLVSLVDRSRSGKVLLSKDYRFSGHAVAGSSASVFGRQMSDLVRQMSVALQKDLCRVLRSGGGSS